MKLSAALLIGFAMLASPRLASAQGAGGRDQGKDKEIPEHMRPPAGMCRVWLDDVPAAQQPAPTDCPTAVRNRPAKGRVVFGDDYATPKKKDTTKTTGKPPAIKGFVPSSGARKPPIFPPK